jgi:hypothetical protein
MKAMHANRTAQPENLEFQKTELLMQPHMHLKKARNLMRKEVVTG